ncbi:hypothetical protein N7G274_004509 [Stereocaulon virgatum]|uniref:Uncharacterized protein n=1 Tax=Stereocaulon virgatum TaxID=373712 RepID=A0ABR4ACA4_9LECA
MLQRGACVNLPINFHGRTLDAAIGGTNAGTVVRALEEGVEVYLEYIDDPVPPARRQWWVSALSEKIINPTLARKTQWIRKATTVPCY